MRGQFSCSRLAGCFFGMRCGLFGPCGGNATSLPLLKGFVLDGPTLNQFSDLVDKDPERCRLFSSVGDLL